MTIPAPTPSDTKSQLRKTMGFWDVLLFNIATVLGPRWIAAAGHNGTSSISLWVLAAVFFFVPGALVINELSSRFPEEGGLYAWAKEAFGPFHGFIAGWTYWIYTVFYFPGLLLAWASMSAYIIGGRGAELAQNRTFLLTVSLGLLLVAVVLNIIGLNIGKWLQNAGGVGTYVPLVILVVIGAIVALKHGSATHFTLHNMLPAWNWDTVNFWSQIAFAFTGLELVSAMSEEVRDPRRTLPRAVFGAGALIALMYIVGTFAILALIPAANIDPQSGVFNAITIGSVGAQDRRPRHARRDPRHLRQRRRSRQHRRRHRARAVRRRHRSLPARSLRQNPSEVEDALHFDPRAGLALRRHPFTEPDSQQHRGCRLSARGQCGHHPLLHSVPLHVCRGHSPRGPQRSQLELRMQCSCPAARRVSGSAASLDLLSSFSESPFPFSRPAARDKVYEFELIGGTLGSVLIGLVLYWRGARSK